ncbi:hypothetical protein V1264_002185 [Littorina saxatilis]|uniref:Uncharacterized protein n=1 Tax=Littorina saxatilis TaxID=31220 RepID=A0AAN9C432_9CAEN
MKICAGDQSEAGVAKGDNSSCVTGQQGTAAVGVAAMTPEDMEIVVAKIVSLLVLTILSVLSGLLPLRLLVHFPRFFTHHRQTADYFLRGLRCLSGGVFLATGFLHLLPDTREKMKALLKNLGSRTKYSVTELLIMAGFFLVIFVEQIIKCLYLRAERSDEIRSKKAATSNTDGGGGRGSYSGMEAAGGSSYRYNNDKTVIPSTLDDLDEELAESNACDFGGGFAGGGSGGGGCESGEGNAALPVDCVRKDSCVGFSGASLGNGVGFTSSPGEHDSDSIVSDTLIKEEHNAFMDPMQDDFDFPPPHRDLEYDIEHVPVTLRCNHSLRQSHSLPELGVTKVVKQLSQADLTRRAHFRSIIYILALSLHGIFEGLALGLQSRESTVWSLCFAVCLHRCVLAFQLGTDLCGAKESQGTAFLCVGTFTLISALGIVAGIIFSSGALLYTDVTVAEAILQSLATGTILYIVFFDILFKDLQGVGDLKRVSSCFVGFSLMAILLAIITR